MTNAPRDNNGVAGALAILSSDGSTVVPLTANTANNRKIRVSDGTGGSDLGPSNAGRDDNRVPVLMATSSVDGVTPVALYSTADGRLLINTQ